MLICYSSNRKLKHPEIHQSQPKLGLLVILPRGHNCPWVRDTALIFRSEYLEPCSLTLEKGHILFPCSRMRKKLSLTADNYIPIGQSLNSFLLPLH